MFFNMLYAYLSLLYAQQKSILTYQMKMIKKYYNFKVIVNVKYIADYLNIRMVFKNLP